MDNVHRTGLNWKAAFVVLIAVVLVAVFGRGWTFGPEILEQNISQFAPGGLAERMVQLEFDAEITDEFLEKVRSAVMAKAADGDVEAAAVVFDLAARQRSTHQHHAPTDESAEGANP